MYRALNHVVNNRNHVTGIRLNVAFNLVCLLRILFLHGANTASALTAQGLKLSPDLVSTEWIMKSFQFQAAMPSFFRVLALSFKELDMSSCVRMTYH